MAENTARPDLTPAGKPEHDALELAARVAELLKRAGFEHRYTSMKSEACYYGWPGRREVIRVATHKFGKGKVNINGHVVVAKITLRGTHLVRRGRIRIADEKILSIVGGAIGQYFLAGRAA